MNSQGCAILLSATLHVLILTILLVSGHYLNVKEHYIAFRFDILMPDSLKTGKGSFLPEKRGKDSYPLRRIEALPQPETMTNLEPISRGKTPEPIKERINTSLPLAIKDDKNHRIGGDLSLFNSTGRAKVQILQPSLDRGSLDTESATGMGSGEVLSAKAETTSYLREHFDYIKDRIMRNVSYPERARRMSWEGKVVVSFVVKSDGSIVDVQINQSSGVPLLDKNACETVVKTAPFPRPPIPARLIIPLVYRLN